TSASTISCCAAPPPARAWPGRSERGPIGPAGGRGCRREGFVPTRRGVQGVEEQQGGPTAAAARPAPAGLRKGLTMPTVSLALRWHQHQPYYPDDVAGENPMPWVRLHGTKDYLGMAMHLDEVPEFRCTVNLVPSLLLQLQAYVDGATDRHLIASRAPADGL